MTTPTIPGVTVVLSLLMGMTVRFLPAFLVAVATAVAADCRTSLGVPCFTLSGTQTQWEIFIKGATEIRKVTSTFMTAVRRDSSTVYTRDSNAASLFSSMQRKGSRLYLAPERQVVTVDHTGRTVARREPLTWTDLPYRRSSDGDLTCSSGIRHFGTDLKNTGKMTVAGLQS